MGTSGRGCTCSELLQCYSWYSFETSIQRPILNTSRVNRMTVRLDRRYCDSNSYTRLVEQARCNGYSIIKKAKSAADPCSRNPMLPILSTHPPPHFLKIFAPSLSISLPSVDVLPAASHSLCHASASLILTASSAALTRMPHFSYMVTDSPCSRPVHLGINAAARRGLPAWRVRL